MSRRRVLKPKEPRGAQGAMAGGLDALGQGGGTPNGPVGPVQDFREMDTPNTRPAGEVGDGSLEGEGVSGTRHTDNVVCDTIESSPYTMEILKLATNHPGATPPS